MAGEGLEELGVGLDEGAHVAEPLADDEQAERPILAPQRPDDCILEPTRTQKCVESVRGAPAREQHRRASRGDLAKCRSVLGGELLLRVHEQLALRTADAPQRPLVLGGREQQDLRVLGAQQPARGDEQLPDRESELGRPCVARIDS